MTNEAGLEFQNEQPLAEVFHPGVFILDEMKARGWTFYDLAAAIHPLDSTPLWRVIHRGGAVTEGTAEQLAMIFGTSCGLWLGLQRAHDYWLHTNKGKMQ